MRALAAAVLLLLAGPVRTETLQLTHDQALAVGRQAYLQGNAELANAIAREILATDPHDRLALLLFTASGPQVGQANLARRAGAAAWRESRGQDVAPALRHEIARYTALAALAENRPLLSQYWLRRALDVAPDAAALTQTEQDIRDLQARSPVRLGFDLSVTPTSNLNGGASSDSLTIDDWFYLGDLSAAAQALSGWRAEGAVRATWTLGSSASSKQDLTLGLNATSNHLSGAAKDSLAESALTDSFDATSLNRLGAELEFGHAFVPQGAQSPSRIALAFGQTSQGGDILGPHLRLDFDTPLWAGDDSAISLSSGFERKWLGGQTVDARRLALGAVQTLGEGEISLHLQGSDQSTAAANGSFDQISAGLGYQMDQPIGPVRLGVTVEQTWRDYDAYQLGFLGVVDGRHDRSVGLSVNMAFPDAAVMGFEPVLTLSNSATTSNISRFENRETGVSFGVSTRF